MAPSDPDTAAQERIAHLERTVDDLSEALADHAARLDSLERRLALLMAREAERAADGSGGVMLGDERPPHW